MGREANVGGNESESQKASSDACSRPSIFIVGSTDAGKRSIFSRLTSSEAEDISISMSGISCHGWTIDTKYYTANVCIWLAHLSEKTAENARSLTEQCDALVMVFDLNNLSSFEILKEWSSGVDLQKFEIVLCVGNKADLVPGHFAHAEYRRLVQKGGESSSDPHPEFWDYGIDRQEGCSLLNEDEDVSELQNACIDWCRQNNIEYVEACAVNDTFDKCLSVNGDSQGIHRIWEALAAHMWPGMVMKSPGKLPNSSTSEGKEDFSEDESNYEIEYELLSNGSADFDDSWVSVDSSVRCSIAPEQRDNTEFHENSNKPSNSEVKSHDVPIGSIEVKGSTSQTGSVSEAENKSATTSVASTMTNADVTSQKEVSMNDLEQLMHEMAYMRENLRLMPDSHRREIAGKLAMKMAYIFADEGDSD
eukprot:TRINITY_DN12488_c0_g1_i1.p1 TRINITY_DN12488_c0_g1~~TRINITY_DN12488_c0_g1_i1.p1  ORF type:complete len:420 (-),score=104.86 TRINITY_DN12488_c0_g1_i1:63-1322(-)